MVRAGGLAKKLLLAVKALVVVAVAMTPKSTKNGLVMVGAVMVGAYKVLYRLGGLQGTIHCYLSSL
jgi:hypothetical protein